MPLDAEFSDCYVVRRLSDATTVAVPFQACLNGAMRRLDKWTDLAIGSLHKRRPRNNLRAPHIERPMDDLSPQAAAAIARTGIEEYLEEAHGSGRLDEQLFNDARRQTFPNLLAWLTDEAIDRVSPRLKEGVCRAIEQAKWEDIVNAYRQSVRFGTGGIRGMMAFDRESILRLKTEGIGAPILKGPNTINDLVLMLTSTGVARFGRSQNPPFQKVVIGYDSRVRGQDFAALVAKVFLAFDYTVYFFDAPCPYPEVTFAIPCDAVKADVGILISASHNDYRYNGYKLSCANGSQFDARQRDEMYRQFIAVARPADIRLCEFRDAGKDRLWFLGGREPLEGVDYAGREGNLIDMHRLHLGHVKRFLMTPDLPRQQASSPDPLRIGFCAFHGAGRVAVPRLLREVGFTTIKPITLNGLNDLDGMFPSFCSDPGREQQPDPGDPRAADVAAKAFIEQYGSLDEMDVLIGTDPDADRCGIVVKVDPARRELYGGKEYALLPADDAWALLLWYRLQREIETHGHVVDADRKFIVLSTTTSDAIVRVATKFGLGVIKTWVGFACLAAAVRDVWEGKWRDLAGLDEGRPGGDGRQLLCHPFVCSSSGLTDRRSINVAAMEQSNGFSILGGPPPDQRSLGGGGHVRDKDGTLAALLVAEIAAWAKSQGTTLLELLDQRIYLDPEIGLFVNLYEPDPLDGEYPGIEGDKLKKAILRRALGYAQFALAGDLTLGGRKVLSAVIYRTGKYDAIYPATSDFQFPDEGVRFYFDADRLQHVTVRPSGTGNSLRFHIQLHAIPTAGNVLQVKKQLREEGMRIMADLRAKLGAPAGR